MPDLDRVTPLILTYDEEVNIGRTLSQLGWARRVIVVDSGSSDGTCDIVRSFAAATLYFRRFDTHANQWNFGLSRVDSEWTLALDADYQVTPAFVRELAAVPNDARESGYFADFDYMVLGKTIPRSLYPPRQVLYRTRRAKYHDDGHTQRVVVEGTSGRLVARLVHDDRKPAERWLQNQIGYARKEARKLTSRPWSELSAVDRIRRTRLLGPPVMLVYCAIIKGLLFGGRAGWYYTLQRTLAEGIVSMALFEHDYKEKL